MQSAKFRVQSDHYWKFQDFRYEDRGPRAGSDGREIAEEGEEGVGIPRVVTNVRSVN
jgi:hypothetical protein